MRNQTNPQTEKLYERQIHRQNPKTIRQSYTQTENIQKERQIPATNFLAQTTKINPLLVCFEITVMIFTDYGQCMLEGTRF